MRLWQTAGSFDASKGTLRGWLTVLARNCALNRARGLRTETALTDDMPHGAGSAEDALLRQERSRLLVRAVKSLTDGEQTLFYRKYYYCQSTAQMAAELGLTERGVEGRLYRLRQRLRNLPRRRKRPLPRPRWTHCQPRSRWARCCRNPRTPGVVILMIRYLLATRTLRAT